MLGGEGRGSPKSRTRSPDSNYDPYAYSSNDGASPGASGNDYEECEAYRVVTRKDGKRAKEVETDDQIKPKVQPEFDDEETKKYYIDRFDPEVK